MHSKNLLGKLVGFGSYNLFHLCCCCRGRCCCCCCWCIAWPQLHPLVPYVVHLLRTKVGDPDFIDAARGTANSAAGGLGVLAPCPLEMITFPRDKHGPLGMDATSSSRSPIKEKVS